MLYRRLGYLWVFALAQQEELLAQQEEFLAQYAELRVLEEQRDYLDDHVMDGTDWEVSFVSTSRHGIRLILIHIAPRKDRLSSYGIQRVVKRMRKVASMQRKDLGF